MFAPSGLGDEVDGERPCQSTPCCRKFGNNNPTGKSQKCLGPPVFWTHPSSMFLVCFYCTWRLPEIKSNWKRSRIRLYAVERIRVCIYRSELDEQAEQDYKQPTLHSKLAGGTREIDVIISMRQRICITTASLQRSSGQTTAIAKNSAHSWCA